MASHGGENVEPPQKQDDLQPHPVKDQLFGITYCLASPPPWRKLFSNFTIRDHSLWYNH